MSRRLPPLDGQRFGKLIVLETLYGAKRGPNSKRSKTLCHCSCDCGNNDFWVEPHLLRDGTRQSCGCDAYERSGKGKRIPMDGKRFGKLVVLETNYTYRTNRGKQKARCLCECDCGNQCYKYAEDLRAGKAISCGCDAIERSAAAKRIDRTGQRYGRLVVVEMIYGDGPPKARCLCDCGNEVIVRSSHLPTGKTQSCGCLQKEAASKARVKDHSGAISEHGIELIEQARQLERGVWLWKCRCGLCGKEFEALPAEVLNGHTRSCGCAIMSSGEQLVEHLLNEYDIDYEPQASLPGCVHKKPLRFDFYLPEKNIAIEVNGKQHYEPIEFFGGQDGFEKTKIRDQIKAEYCEKNNIQLLILPYTMSNTEIRQTIQNIKNA